MAKIQAIINIIQEIMSKENVATREELIPKVYASGYRGSTTNINLAYCILKKRQSEAAVSTTSTTTIPIQTSTM